MAAPKYEQIRYDVDDPIATITLDRPEVLNAWTDQMGFELRHACAAAEDDPRVVALVITGAGRGFCSGADLSGLQAISLGESGPAKPPEALEASPGDPDAPKGLRGPFSFLMSIRKPVIAAINGPCAGMAVPIALCCDLRFASDTALFTTAFVQRGLIAEWGISWTLSRLVGPAHAMDLLLSARKVKADEAKRLGLVNRVLPSEDLLPFVRRYVEGLAESSSPTSMAVMKRQVYEDLHRGLDEANDVSYRKMLESFSRPDFKEGVQAFLEKRKPAFNRL